MTYKRPIIEIVEVNMVLLQSSEIGPDATSIGSPSVSNEAKSVWDEVNEQYNINKEENYGEDWI